MAQHQIPFVLVEFHTHSTKLVQLRYESNAIYDTIIYALSSRYTFCAIHYVLHGSRSRLSESIAAVSTLY